MQSNHFIKAGLLGVSIALLSMATWEVYLRNQGFPISYDDNDPLWANKRAMVYEPKDEATVFIGSSRIKYDLDIPTWEAMTGDRVIQLANLGSSPRPVLTDLSNDPHFAGKLIIDVVEGLFFSEVNRRDVETFGKISYFHQVTPTQKFSFQVNHFLESEFVFLDQTAFSFNGLINKHRVNRPGVFQLAIFPDEFHGNTFGRQSFMMPRFLTDTSLQRKVQDIWAFNLKQPRKPPVRGDSLQMMLYSIKAQVDKIKSRGGKVLFVRPPSSGPFRTGELKNYPRALYWDALLKVTGCPGVYFEDYPETAHMICPEWSHLTPADAVVFTRTLVRALETEKGWSFPKKN